MTGTQATLSAYDDPRPTSEDLERLGRVDRGVLSLLIEARDGEGSGWVGRDEILDRVGYCALNSAISRLRHRRGYRIDSRRDPEEPDSGRWEYRLLRRADAMERGGDSE